MEIKRITLHPVLSDGTVDLNVNLYPKSLLDGIVDREGNEVEIATKEELSSKQDSLVSGENIKTVNGSSILGSGNLEIKDIIEIAWADLKALRDNSQLRPGKFYRITDYQCTTAQTDTSSAGHQFDIIVFAISESVLDENGYAALHENDTYFANSKLSAWRLKYCLDNDTDRFIWADSANGKGVIYWLKDEFDNECGYDFKNILFKRYNVAIKSSYANNAIFYKGFEGMYVGTKAYDDAQGREIVIPISYTIPDENDFIWAYTFNGKDSSVEDEPVTYDLSVKQSKLPQDYIDHVIEQGDDVSYLSERCCNNVIRPLFMTKGGQTEGLNYAIGTIQSLNDIVFFNEFYARAEEYEEEEETWIEWDVHVSSIANNDFCFDCYGMTFQRDSTMQCKLPSYGNCFNRDSSIIVNQLKKAVCGASSTLTSNFGCTNLICHDFVKAEVNGGTGYGESWMFILQNSSRINIGQNCTSITINAGCGGVTIGNACSSINIGGHSSSIAIGNNCSSISLPEYSNRISVGNNCEGIGTINADNMTPIKYADDWIIDDDVRYVNIKCTEWASSSNHVKNIHVRTGVYSTSSNRKDITVTNAANYMREFVSSTTTTTAIS